MIFSSCSSDDDSNSEPSTPSLVGVWKQINQIDFCSTGSQEVLNLNTCQQTGRLIFNENGTYTWTFYELNGSDCELDGTLNGTWEITNNMLNIAGQGGTFQYTTLEISQNSFKIGANEDSSNPDPCGTGVLLNFTFDFERVE
ncbi:hypothetical protein BFP78_15415 [Gaetbulibacter sp. 5U11]|nr:hypothetical protein BFP78_15415 [Gaetbulibacter sp. 5U11]